MRSGVMNAVCDGTVGVLIRAADAYERALSLAPDYALAREILGCIYVKQG